MSDPQIVIEAVCEVHHRSGRLVVRRDGDRIVLDTRSQVTSQSTTRFVVRFEGEDQTVSIRPHLMVRVIPR